MTAYFADRDGRPIVNTVRRTKPFASSPGNDDWRPISLELPSNHPGAASLVIELGLLQPSKIVAGSSARALLVEDIFGSAWFDDLTVAQVPRVELSTGRIANVFSKSTPVHLTLTVKDRLTSDLAARLEVRDGTGQVVFQRTGMMSLAASPTTAESASLRGIIEVPDMRAGWYQASVDLTSQGQFVGRHVLNFIKLGDDGALSSPDPRFGLIATTLAEDSWPILPQILRGTGFGRLKLAVWSTDGSISSDAGDPRFTRLMEELNARGVQLTACLTGLPPDVRRVTGASKWDDLLLLQGTAWQDQLAFLISRHANHLQHWQLFGDEVAERITSEPKLRSVYSKILGEYRKLEANPDLALPWPALYELDGELPATVALNVPTEVLPEQLPLYAADFTNKPGHQLSLTLAPIDRIRYGRDAQVRDMALRIGFALASGAERLDVPLPADVRTDDEGNTLLEPDELMLVTRTLTAQLSGAVYRGRVPLAPGVEALLFDREGAGVMLVWAKSNGTQSTGPTVVQATLGGSATRVDLYGNTYAIPRAPRQRGRSTPSLLEVGSTPFLVTGVDAALLRFTAGLTLDNPLVESSYEPHERRLKVTNTFPLAITGSIRLRGPSGWTVAMPNGSFNLNPGESVELPVTLEFPVSSSAGEKTLTADVSLTGAGEYELSVPIAMKLGLSDVGVTTSAVRSGPDLLVQQVITNYGKRPIDYTAFVAVPGQARQDRLVVSLAPGRSTIKKYRFADVPKTDAAMSVRSGLRELDGTRMLNESVQVY
ncbi:MAG: NEW3 domain-containing protein [Tepidisphaeraceae bacterium]